VPILRRAVYQHTKAERKKEMDARFEVVRSILAIVGDTTVNWAAVERMLDELIAHYQHHYTDLSLEHPISLSKKLEYLKSHMQPDLRLTSQTREFLRHSRIEVARLGKERHDIIHGMIQRTQRPFVWRTQRVAYRKALTHIVHREYDTDEILKIYGEISDLVQFLSPRIWLLTGGERSAFPSNKVEETLRELGIA